MSRDVFKTDETTITVTRQTQIGRSGYAIREIAHVVRVGSGAVPFSATAGVEESVLKVILI